MTATTSRQHVTQCRLVPPLTTHSFLGAHNANVRDSLMTSRVPLLDAGVRQGSVACSSSHRYGFPEHARALGFVLSGTRTRPLLSRGFPSSPRPLRGLRPHSSGQSHFCLGSSFIPLQDFPPAYPRNQQSADPPRKEREERLDRSWSVSHETIFNSTFPAKIWSEDVKELATFSQT